MYYIVKESQKNLESNWVGSFSLGDFHRFLGYSWSRFFGISNSSRFSSTSAKSRVEGHTKGHQREVNAAVSIPPTRLKSTFFEGHLRVIRINIENHFIYANIKTAAPEFLLKRNLIFETEAMIPTFELNQN